MFKKFPPVLFMLVFFGIANMSFAETAPSPAAHTLVFTPSVPAGSPDFSKWQRADQEFDFAIPHVGLIKDVPFVAFLVNGGVCKIDDIRCAFKIHYFFSGDKLPSPTKVVGRYLIQRISKGVPVGSRVEAFVWGDYDKPKEYHYFRFVARFIGSAWVPVPLASTEYQQEDKLFSSLWNFEAERQNPTKKR